MHILLPVFFCFAITLVMAEPPEERDAVFSGNLTEQETADGKGNWSLGKWAELLLILAWSSS